MSFLIDPYSRREFGDCFYLEIPLDCSDEELHQRIHELTKVEKIVGSIMDGRINT